MRHMHDNENRTLIDEEEKEQEDLGALLGDLQADPSDAEELQSETSEKGLCMFNAVFTDLVTQPLSEEQKVTASQIGVELLKKQADDAKLAELFQELSIIMISVLVLILEQLLLLLLMLVEIPLQIQLHTPLQRLMTKIQPLQTSLPTLLVMLLLLQLITQVLPLDLALV